MKNCVCKQCQHECPKNYFKKEKIDHCDWYVVLFWLCTECRLILDARTIFNRIHNKNPFLFWKMIKKSKISLCLAHRHTIYFYGMKIFTWMTLSAVSGNGPCRDSECFWYNAVVLWMPLPDKTRTTGGRRLAVLITFAGKTLQKWGFRNWKSGVSGV